MIACLLLTRAAVAAAQQPLVAPAPPVPEFFTRFDFHLTAAWLGDSPPTAPAVPPLSGAAGVGGGVGMNALTLNQERGFGWSAIHNVYLEYAVELGIPGLILFLLLLVGCVKSVALVQRRCAGVPALRELFYLAEGIQISLIAFSLAAFFHPVAYHLYFYYIAALAVAAHSVGMVAGIDPDAAQCGRSV